LFQFNTENWFVFSVVRSFNSRHEWPSIHLASNALFH
jgi:hypothetical protein